MLILNTQNKTASAIFSACNAPIGLTLLWQLDVRHLLVHWMRRNWVMQLCSIYLKQHSQPPDLQQNSANLFQSIDSSTTDLVRGSSVQFLQFLFMFSSVVWLSRLYSPSLSSSTPRGLLCRDQERIWEGARIREGANQNIGCHNRDNLRIVSVRYAAALPSIRRQGPR